MRISEAFQTFKDRYLGVRLYSKATITGNIWVYRSFIDCCGDINCEDLGQNHLDAWINFMQEKGNTQSTIISNLSRFKVFIGYLNKHELCTLDKDSVYVPRKPKTLPKYVSPQTVDKMVASASSIRDSALISMLFATGIRNAEVRNLLKNEVSGLNVTIIQGKGMRDRTTYMDPRTRELLDRYLAARVDVSPYVFVTSTGNPIAGSTLRYIIAHTAKRAGVGNVHPHMFRHGIATHFMNEGMHVRKIQKFLGHSFLATTEMYMHVSDQDLQTQHYEILTAKKHK